MPLTKPPGIESDPFKSAKWDELTAGRNFSQSDAPALSLLCQWYKIADTAQDELSGVRKGRQEPKLLKVPHSRLFTIRDAVDIYSEQSTPHRVSTLVQKRRYVVKKLCITPQRQNKCGVTNLSHALTTTFSVHSRRFESYIRYSSITYRHFCTEADRARIIDKFASVRASA